MMRTELDKLDECVKMINVTREAFEVAQEALSTARRVAMTLESQSLRQLVLRTCADLKASIPPSVFK